MKVTSQNFPVSIFLSGIGLFFIQLLSFRNVLFLVTFHDKLMVLTHLYVQMFLANKAHSRVVIYL